MKRDIYQRLRERVKLFWSCENPEQLASLIWSKEFEEATGTSKSSYRDSFINWIQWYSKKDLSITNPIWSNYQRPRDLANGVYPKYLDNNEEDTIWFNSLRRTIIEWVEWYKKGPSDLKEVAKQITNIDWLRYQADFEEEALIVKSLKRDCKHFSKEELILLMFKVLEATRLADEHPSLFADMLDFETLNSDDV